MNPTPAPYPLLLRIARLWRPHAGVGTLIVLCLLVQQGFAASFALSLKLVIDQALAPKGGAVLLRVLGGLFGLFVLSAAATILADGLIARVSARMLGGLRLQLFSHLQGLSLAYYQGEQAGDLSARFGNDLAELEKGVIERPLDGICAILGLLTSLALLFFLSPLIFCLVLVALPLLSLAGGPLRHKAAGAAYERKQAEGLLGGTVVENVRMQPVIQAFGLVPLVLRRFQDQLDKLNRLTFRESFLSALVGTSASQGVVLLQLLALFAGALLAHTGSLSAGGLAALWALLGNLTKDAYSLTKKVAPSLLKAAGGLRRMDELLAQRPWVVDRPGAEPLKRFSGEICFADVWFSYPGGAASQLCGINLHIRAGERVALVGQSGSGKSTLLALLLRFYDPKSGAVRVDGHDLREVQKESLREQIGLVLQEPLLFSTTVRDNIRLGSPAASDAEVEAAARAAEIHEQILSLPQGYNTPIGEMGSRLSGGQRQRIAVARAILRDPPILILDEATSALDPVTAAQLVDTLARLSQSRTVISVTHRLWTAREADRIFVLSDGRVIEEGRHNDLLRAQGVYYRLWQTEGESP